MGQVRTAELTDGLVELLIELVHRISVRGVRLGRPPAMTPEQVRHARDLLTHPDNTVSSIARLIGVSRATIYKYVPEIASGDYQQHSSAG